MAKKPTTAEKMKFQIPDAWVELQKLGKVTARVDTRHRQTIVRSSQVAYVPPSKAFANTLLGIWELKVEPGRLTIAYVYDMVQTFDGFAEADPVVMLLLSDGAIVDCEDVVVTNGKYQ